MQSTPANDDEVLARRLVGETLCDLRTARRAVRGEHIRGVLGQRLREAAEQLGGKEVR